MPKILLVDDSPDNLSELENLLHCFDAELVRAFSVSQARSMAHAVDFSVAIVSAALPGVPGSLLMAELRGLPVILLYPAYPDEAAFNAGYAAGAADVFSRPLVPEALVGKVRTYLTLAGQRKAAETAVFNRAYTAGGVHREDPFALFSWLSQSIEQIARSMASSLDMREVPNLVLEQLPAVVPYKRGSILLRDGESLRMVAHRGFPPDWPPDARIPIRQGDVYQQIVETRQALLVGDVTATSAWLQMEGLPLDRSWLGVPLASKDRVIGMISLTRSEEGAFNAEEVTFIRAFASQAAVALVNAGLLSDLQRFNEHLEQLVQDRTEELNRAYARLEKIDQTKTSFISVAAHELRTPLTLINGYTSLLGSVIKENKDAGPLVEGILTGEKRLLDVVNSMIDVSKIDTQALLVCKSSISIWLIIKVIYSEYKAALRERHIDLSIMDMENLPEIQADSELMGKLFRQLIGNAIKYTPDGGSITIQGKNIPGKSSGEGQAESIEILIRDTGIGIDPAYHELIFEKFYQMGPVELHSSGKTRFKGGGPGLGLAIARGIVRAHGGRIWAESPGHDEKACPGSCFHVMLPVG